MKRTIYADCAAGILGNRTDKAVVGQSRSTPLRRPLLIRGFLFALLSLCGARTDASQVIWDINPVESYLKIDIPDTVIPGLGTLQFRNQDNTAWTANKASYDGLLATDWSASNIEFLSGQSSIVGVNTGSYRPNPAAFNPLLTNAANPNGQFANTTTAPAVYGARLNGANGPLTLDAARLSIQNTSIDLGGTAPFVSNSFLTNGLNLAGTGLVNYDGLVAPIIGQLLPDFSQGQMSLFADINSGANGSITSANYEGGFNYKITVPLQATTRILEGIGYEITGTVTGQIVAYANLMREPIISSATPIPDSEVILDYNGTGLDWTYAGSTQATEGGLLAPPSYRAAEGWRFATAAEWALRPDWKDFTRPGFSVPVPEDIFTDHASYRFTTQYWHRLFNHVNLTDAELGRIGNGQSINVSVADETFYVRNHVAVPEPGSLALFGLGAIGLVVIARRRGAAMLPVA